MTLTVTPTINLTSTPPSVTLAVTDSTGTVTSATIQRYASGAASNTVRTTDGGPLPLTTSGATTVGTLVDIEAPYGVPVAYSVNGGPLTARITVDELRVWLTHPTRPGLSLPLTVTGLPARTQTVARGLFPVLGRATPLAVTDGARKAPAFTLGVRTHTLSELAALDQLLDDASALLLNVPGSKAWGIPASYVSIGDVTENRTVPTWGAGPLREWSLPCQVVDPPISGTAANTAGGTPAARTWADLGVERQTWNNAKTAYSLWSKAEAGTPG